MRAAAEMIQLHGAIGITWEHPAHRYLKRAHGALQLFGGSAVRRFGPAHRGHCREPHRPLTNRHNGT